MPAIRGTNSTKKTRRHKRDLDQIHADLASKRHLQQYIDTKSPEDLPAYGQHYCVPCAKWFSDEPNCTAHAKGKPHKRRVKQLREEPYSQREAEAAVGLTTDNGVVGKRGGGVSKEAEMEDADAVVQGEGE